jgi:hypothetical protein
MSCDSGFIGFLPIVEEFGSILLRQPPGSCNVKAKEIPGLAACLFSANPDAKKLSEIFPG